MKKIMIYAVSLLLLTGCFDLNKQPEGVLSTSKPFQEIGEIRNYVNMFYVFDGSKNVCAVLQQNMNAGGEGGIAGNDVMSDNMMSSSPNIRLNAGFSISNAVRLSEYEAIRNLNYLLVNKENFADQANEDYKQLIGEAYYFKAWFYYQLLVKYGPVTWIDEPLDPNDGGMDKSRDSRLKVADNILGCLDKAIENLKEAANSASMRIHRDVARALKSEVALFEATWERYHKAKNDGFFDAQVTDDKIKNYLNVSIKAAEDVEKRGVWAIYSTGRPNQDYRMLFQMTDLSSNKEVLWFRKYDGSEIGNSVNRYLNKGGGGIGLTASLIDDYLKKDGSVPSAAELLAKKRVYGEELHPDYRDPRLAQTVCTPGQALRPNGGYTYELPPLVGAGAAYHQNMTGYSLLKHVQIDYTGDLDAENKGATPAIQCRYADVLLNHAEALAELDGAAHATKIKEVLHPLRARVGMPDVDFDREYNTATDYPFRGLNKYIQAVRRERRVEQAVEGRRFKDICRWGAAEELIRGQVLKGALYKGSNLAMEIPEIKISLTGIESDADRYLAPVPTKYQFNVQRDYLLPIEQRLINLTNNKWTQNPGW